MIQPLIPMCAKLAVDLKLFEHLVAKNGPITTEELAMLSGAESLLIRESEIPTSRTDF
jgi:predicted transcriptional regulator